MASPEAAEPPETAADSPIFTGSLDWADTGRLPGESRIRPSNRTEMRRIGASLA